MRAVYIISNNPAVYEKYAAMILSEQQDYWQVLLAARNAVHQGHRLLMHPESGSVKPYQTPYRSLLLSDETELALDMTSLGMIESAISRYQAFMAMGQLPRQQSYPQAILRDFQRIDLSLITQGIERTPM